MAAAKEPNKITVELDPGLTPLARVVVPNGRSGYVHYSVLAKRLLGTLSSDTASDVTSGRPLVLPGKGLMIWPDSHVMAYLQPAPVKRIRLDDRTVSEPIALCPLIWVWQFNQQAPHALSLSRLFVAETIPLLPTDAVRLQAWPFGNVHTNGEVCWGGVHTNHTTWDKPEDVDALFWDSVPNTDLETAGISLSTWVRRYNGSDVDEEEAMPLPDPLLAYCSHLRRQSVQALVNDLIRGED